MSDIALTSAMSGAAPTIRPKDPLEKLLPGPLTQLSRVRADGRDRVLHRDLRQHQAAAQGGDHRDGEGRGRPDGVPDARRARQLGAGRLGGRLWIPGAHSAEGLRARPVRAARRGDHADRRSRDGREGNRVSVSRRRERSEHAARRRADAGHAGRRRSQTIVARDDEPGRGAEAGGGAHAGGVGGVVAPARRRQAGAEVDFGSRTVVAVFLGTRRRPATPSRSPARARQRRADRRVAASGARSAAGVGAGPHQSRAHRHHSEVRRRDRFEKVEP